MSPDHKLEDLVKLMQTLRGKNGCPWDKEQTHESLIPYLVEETYEVIDAIYSRDPAKFREELADLLFQIIFHCQIANEGKTFNIKDVIEICLEKMTRRHPHVFGDKTAASPEEVLKLWHELKERERSLLPEVDKRSVVEGLPKHLPALQKAQKLQKKVAKVGFDWKRLEDVIDKVEEELAEVKEAVSTKDQAAIEEELGDLLFAVVNLSRFLKLDSETVLHKTVNKFIERFKKVESELQKKGKALGSCTLEEMDEAWEETKKKG